MRHRRGIIRGHFVVAAAVAALVLAGAPAGAFEWIDRFERDELGDQWEIVRSEGSGGSASIVRGRMALKVEQTRHCLAMRELGADGTDASPLRVDCQIMTHGDGGLPVVMALAWDSGCTLGIGPYLQRRRSAVPRAVWLTGGIVATGLVSAALTGLALISLHWGLRGWNQR